MRRAVIADGRLAVYEDGTVMDIVDGNEIPVQMKIYGHGYYGFSRKRMYMVHRLVAEAFIPNPEHKPQVNHKDGNKLNNHVSNLEWVTAKENIRHACATGLKGNKPHEDYRKCNNKFYRLRYAAGLTIAKAAEAIGVSMPTIISLEYGRTLPRGGIAKQVADVYGSTIDELYEKEESA